MESSDRTKLRTLPQRGALSRAIVGGPRSAPNSSYFHPLRCGDAVGSVAERANSWTLAYAVQHCGFGITQIDTGAVEAIGWTFNGWWNGGR